MFRYHENFRLSGIRFLLCYLLSVRKLPLGNFRSETSARKHRLGDIQLASKQFLFILGLRV